MLASASELQQGRLGKSGHWSCSTCSVPAALGRALGPQRDPGCSGPEAWAEAVTRRDALHRMGLCIMLRKKLPSHPPRVIRRCFPVGKGPHLGAPSEYPSQSSNSGGRLDHDLCSADGETPAQTRAPRSGSQRGGPRCPGVGLQKEGSTCSSLS